MTCHFFCSSKTSPFPHTGVYFCQRSVQLWQAAAAAFQRHMPAAIDIWPGQPGRMHLRTWVPSPPKSESRSAFLRRLLEARIYSGVQHLHAAQRRSQVQGNTLRAGPTTLYRRPYTPLQCNQMCVNGPFFVSEPFFCFYSAPLHVRRCGSCPACWRSTATP